MKSVCLVCLACASFAFCDVGLLMDWPCSNFQTEIVPDGDDCSNTVSWMAFLNKELEKQGGRLVLCSLSDAGIKQLHSPSMDAILFNNCTPSWMGRDMVSLLSTIKAKKILLTWEPPTVIPTLHDREFWKNFDVVLTWDASRLESGKVILFSYPSAIPMREPVPPFSKRRLLTQISANKQFEGPNELYSSRRKINEYFDAHQECDYTFYGGGWDRTVHKAFGGSIDDKIATLQNFRFSICFENTKDTTGYITEKIFDCFGAGCVPVYYGAKDISSYIPEGCYIRWERFGSIEKLYDYLKNVSEEEFNGYIKNIKSFLASEAARPFTNKALSHELWTLIKPTIRAKNPRR
jgi:alpha(1,3/1,4) fucosyltransferase